MLRTAMQRTAMQRTVMQRKAMQRKDTAYFIQMNKTNCVFSLLFILKY